MSHPARPPSTAEKVRGVAQRGRVRHGVGAVILVLLPAIVASCSMPAVQSSDISQGELMLQLSDALAGMRSDDADLQEQIDSLRAVVVRQDSLLVRLAAATGVPVR